MQHQFQRNFLNKDAKTGDGYWNGGLSGNVELLTAHFIGTVKIEHTGPRLLPWVYLNFSAALAPAPTQLTNLTTT